MHIFQIPNQSDFESKIKQYKDSGWNIELGESKKNSVFATQSISRSYQIISVIGYGILCLFTLGFYKPAKIELKYAWDQKEIVQIECKDSNASISNIYDIYDRINRKKKIIIDGYEYEGLFNENGKLHGQGKITGSGFVKEGIFQDGILINGKGNETFVDGTFFEFETIRNNWESDIAYKGKKIMADGTTYEGKFTLGTSLQTGKKTDKDGTVYEGHFSLGELHGEGNITDKNGKVLSEGEYEHGILRKGKMIDEYGNIYEGEFNYGYLNGQGKMIDKQKKQTLIGQFYAGKLDGEGEIIYENGDRLKTRFIHGYPADSL